MATVTCPDGHESEATDWCDTCGVAIGAAPSAPAEVAAPPIPAAVLGEPCPNCGTDRIEGEAFCEVCGLDFATGALPQAPATSASVDPAPPPPSGDPSGWTVVLAADRAWFDRNEAESGRVVEFPEQATPRTVELVGDLVTIGRRDDKRGWFPTIDLGVPVLDPSTSRRHAELRRTQDGWDLVDLDSTNGTVLDGERLAAGTPTPVVDGSVVHLGAFTRFVVHGPVTPTPEAPS